MWPGFSVLVTLMLGCDLSLSLSWRGLRPQARVTSISPTQSLSLVPGEVRDLELECGIEGGLGPGLEAAWVRLGGTRASILGEEEELLAVWAEEEGGTSVYEEGVEALMVREGEGAHTWTMVIQRVSITHSGLYQCQVGKINACGASFHPMSFQIFLGDELISSREVSVRIRSHHQAPEPERFVYVKQGGNITLECEDCRGPVCHAARDGVWSRGSRVTLVRLDRGDSGEYSCRVADRRVSISLVVQHPPEITTKYIIMTNK